MTAHVEIERALGLWWLTLCEPGDDKIGTEAACGLALTLWGARRRARRILRKQRRGRRTEVVT